MCGIAGYIDFRKATDEQVLVNMTNTLIHRGPDGSGIETIELDVAQIGLGHRRLAIIDLSEHGKQPMAYEHWWVCFNGEIYNYAEIKKELAILGHTFKGNSDTEMLLHAYAEWGNKCLDKFIGMFAFVLIDMKKQTAFCARDRAGVKPFFYYFKDGLFLFASELKALHAHPRFEKQINLAAVSAFLQYGNVPTPHCIFEHTHKLSPGHCFTLPLNTQPQQLPSPVQYWNVYGAYNQPKTDISFEEAKKHTKELLQSACEYRMVADVPVGVFLSGGYDSTCVTALLQKERTEKIKTFTIGVPDIGLNEAPYAKDIAQHLGTDHTEIMCEQKEALELITNLPHYYDEPFADSSAIPTMLVSKMAREQVTVALSADAGDEVFAGYNRYDYLMRYGKQLEKIPSIARKSLAGIMNVVPSNALPVLRNKYNFHNRYEKLKGLLKNPSSENIMLSLSQQFTDKQIQLFFKQEITPLPTFYTSKELNKDVFSPLSYMMAIDYQTYLLDDILQKVDRATMSASLEGREPFLDHRIIEWAATLPDPYKYNNGEKKFILKEIVHDYVPKTLLDRPKMGFAIPIAHWLQHDLRSIVEEQINEERITKDGVLNWTEIKKIKDQFFSGKKEYDTKLWYILMWQLWMERYG
jgi:asparagine synthase (glutamine-hydrolysing)